MKTQQIEVNSKASQFIETLSPELKSVIISIGKDLRPLLDEIHSKLPTTQCYYGDYLRILSYKPEKAKILALAMLYEGANCEGIQAAVRLVSK